MVVETGLGSGYRDFRNIRLLELPPGITTPEQTAPEVGTAEAEK